MSYVSCLSLTGLSRVDRGREVLCGSGFYVIGEERKMFSTLCHIRKLRLEGGGVRYDLLKKAARNGYPGNSRFG
jgi:hypothetical protein